MNLSQFTEKFKPDQKKLDEIYHYFKKRYGGKLDPWGLNLDRHRNFFEVLWPLFKHYFRVRIHNEKHIKDKPYMIVANHSGQIAIDSVIIMMAFTYMVSPPRIVRSMVERFLPKLPFLGDLVAQTGSVLGDRKNCLYLLEKGESILVFPEGVKGIAKSTSEFYHLKHFTAGFVRMALTSRTDILPIAIVGAEEFYPYVLQFSNLAKLLNLPALPITPVFPWLGPLGMVPLPSPVDIYIGKPYKLPATLSPDAKDADINKQVQKIKRQIQTMVNQGLEHKRDYFGKTEHVKRKRS